MRIQIKNIGAIKDATVDCNGLTVITGKNDSGKSAFCKAFSAFAAGYRNSDDFYDRNFAVYVQNTVKKILKVKDRFSPFYYGGRHDDNGLYRLLSRSPSRINDLVKYISDIHQTIEKVSLDNALFDGRSASSSGENASKIKRQCLDRLEELIAEYTSDVYRGKHLKRCIRAELNSVFFGQVTPLEKFEGNSLISIRSDGFDIQYDYSKDELQVPVVPQKWNSRVYYIENSSILDRLDEESGEKKSLRAREDFATSKLEDYLIRDFFGKRFDLFGLLAEEQYKDILDLINQAYPYDIFVSNGLSITNNAGVRISNEASGRKVFALVKQMLLSGRVDESTTILFDEPENHLHPEWQLLFAKTMKKIVEQTGAKVFCITHSPTLLFAFDTFFKANRDLLRVYYCHREDNGCLFEDVSADISKAHKVLSHPFIQLDLLGEGAI